MRKISYKDISSEMKRLTEPNFSETKRSSVGLEQFMGEYYFIDVEKLISYQNQARRIFNEEDIKNLSETISEHGIRQPLTVLRSPVQEGVFEVVSGERRLRAAKLTGLKKVPCIIIEDPAQAAEIALIENIQRENLHPVELARAINNLVSNRGHGKQSEIARKLGLSKSQLSENLKILEIEEPILEEMLKNNVRGREHYRKLLSLNKEEDRKKYVDGVLGIYKCQSFEKTFVSRSVLRVSLGENGVKVQKSQLKKLSLGQLQEIIKTLEEIIQEWKE